MPPATNVTALVGEAMTKSGVIWVEVPGDRAWPVWHAWVAPTAYVVNGPGEQNLPWLPEEVVLVLRSQDTGGRLLRGPRPRAGPHRRRERVADGGHGAAGAVASTRSTTWSSAGAPSARSPR